MNKRHATFCILGAFPIILLVYSVTESGNRLDGWISKNGSEMRKDEETTPLPNGAPRSLDLEEETREEFSKLNINYTQLLSEIDKSFASENRHERSLKILEVIKILKPLDLKNVIGEIQFKHKTKHTCIACTAEEFYNHPGNEFKTDMTKQRITLEAGSKKNQVMHHIHCRIIQYLLYRLVGLLQHMFKIAPDKLILHLISKVCIKMNIQTPRVCKGFLKHIGREAFYILRRVKMRPSVICSFFFGDYCGDTFSPSHNWSVVFPPEPKPALKPFSVPKEGVETLKVLHLSDTHFDPYYKEGSNADCREPYCCRLSDGHAPNKEAAAGRWGDYRKCDTPNRTLYSMFTHIKDTHPDLDYIIWTGDLPPHDIWNQTRKDNLMILKQTVRQLYKMFPGIPVFPALGNHEAAPANSFPPPFIQNKHAINWLYEELDTYWQKWLAKNISRTVRRGGFYSVQVRPGLRIISINMNYCYNLNLWLLLNSTDPANELQWLIDELQNAEDDGEKVHIIGHIPPGYSDCVRIWSRNYYSIINRYENTIMAQFFGHTHYDEFEVFYDKWDKMRATSIAYIGPSVTTWLNLNPGYRIYYVDGYHRKSTWAVVDHETWIMNLKKSNRDNKAVWSKEYTARQAYHLPSLTPKHWDKFIGRLIKNERVFKKYYKYYWKSSPKKPDCDQKCKKNMICDLRSGRSHDRKYFCP